MKQLKPYILSCVWGLLLIAQIILVFVFNIYNEDRIDVVMYMGWIVWVFSVIFGWMPIWVLKIKGGVSKGKSYVHTTTLVETGIYSIVRHPQYTAGILFSLALILFSQNWIIAIIGAVIITLVFNQLWNWKKDRREREAHRAKLEEMHNRVFETIKDE